MLMLEYKLSVARSFSVHRWHRQDLLRPSCGRNVSWNATELCAHSGEQYSNCKAPLFTEPSQEGLQALRVAHRIESNIGLDDACELPR